MIESTTHGDVLAFRLSSRASRTIGFGVHVFAVRGVLIDTGFPRARREIIGLLDRLRPRGALITHRHEDHAGNAELLASRGIPITAADATLEDLRAPQPIGWYRRYTWGSMTPLRSPVRRFGDDSLTLISTPGHSEDHHAVWDHETGTAFVGDLFLGVKVRVAHDYESPRDHVASLRDIIARAPSRVFCSHRGLLPNGTQMLSAKADWMQSLIDRIDAMHDAGADASNIRRALLGVRTSTHWFSRGDYSPDHIVHAVLRSR